MSKNRGNKSLAPVIKVLAGLTLALVGGTQAFALPSFARQTGESCDSCHVGAFGPQLTPHGIKFKLGGYTDSDGKEGHIPLAAMLIENHTHTSTDNPAPEPGFGSNDNNVMQELSVFLAGKLSDHVGSFMQVTHSGVDKVIELDNTEFRYATKATLFDQPGVYGITLNNNPGMQDPFNTMPAWRFPYTSPALAAASEARTPLLDDGVAGTVYGFTAYTQLDNGIYAEFGLYQSFTPAVLDRVNVGADYELSDAAPYIRVAYTKDNQKDNYSFGMVTMSAKLKDYGDMSAAADKSTDIGVDAHYQFLGNRKKIISVNGSYIMNTNDVADVNQLSVDGSYYLDKTYGGTLRYFSNTVTGGDTKGWTLQGDWSPFGKEESWKAPFANIRVGLQYNLYNTFDGDSSNASDANSMMLFVWASI